MYAYLIRHGIATPRSTGEASQDAYRPLTHEGARRLRQIAEALDELGIRFDEVWSSPLVRARQSAELLRNGSSIHPIRITESLGPGGDLKQLFSEISQSSGLSAIALVGHEPDLGILAGYLLTGRSESIIAFKKGGIACIELAGPPAPGCGRLRWMLTPRQLRRMT